MSGLYDDFTPGARLTFKDVSAERGDQTLFSNLSFTLIPGEILWIKGANGIGKTTLLRMAAGLTPPQSGYIDVTFQTETMRQNPGSMICFQGHHDGFKAALTSQEELDFWANIYGYSGKVSDILAAVELADKADLPTGKLSAGQKRRLAFGRLLISQRCIWILDEPNAAMDSRGTALIERLIAQHISHNGSVVVASHSQAKSLGAQARVLTLEAAS